MPLPVMRRIRPMWKLTQVALLGGFVSACAGRGWACDVCAVYTATALQETRTGVRLGLGEQFTHFGTLQNSGEAVANPYHEHLDSSITQLLAGYTVGPRLSLQVNLPIINRDYRRVEAKGVVEGDETGIGDMSVSATGLLFSRVDESSIIRLSGLLGVKLPTGSPRRLREELGSAAGSSDPNIPPIFRSSAPFHPYHSSASGAPPSGIHGHDLVFGSGSTDVLVGGQLLTSYDRWFGTVAGQYSLRTVGSYGYEFANELMVSGGPGFYVLLSHAYSLGVQALVTVETKSTDNLNGAPQTDTGITSVYAGPGFHLTWGSTLSAELAADIPAIQNNSSLQLVPDYRLRGGVVWRF